MENFKHHLSSHEIAQLEAKEKLEELKLEHARWRDKRRTDSRFDLWVQLILITAAVLGLILFA